MEEQAESSMSSFFVFPRRIHELNLPRFSISSDYKLKDILSQLEIKKVFTQEADLSGITDDHKLEVSQVSPNFGQFILLLGA